MMVLPHFKVVWVAGKFPRHVCIIHPGALDCNLSRASLCASKMQRQLDPRMEILPSFPRRL